MTAAPGIVSRSCRMAGPAGSRLQSHLVADLGPEKFPAGNGYRHCRILSWFLLVKSTMEDGGARRDSVVSRHNRTTGHHGILPLLFGKDSTKDGRAFQHGGASCHGRSSSGPGPEPEGAR